MRWTLLDPFYIPLLEEVPPGTRLPPPKQIKMSMTIETLVKTGDMVLRIKYE